MAYSSNSWKSSSTDNSSGPFNPVVGAGRSTKSQSVISSSPSSSYGSAGRSNYSPGSSYQSYGSASSSHGSSFGSPGSANSCGKHYRDGFSGQSRCSLCMTNRETKAIYMSHSLKDSKGNVTCPILYANVCPYCKATGKDAHTKNYCPMNPNPQHSFKDYLKYRNASGGTYDRKFPEKRGKYYN